MKNIFESLFGHLAERERMLLLFFGPLLLCIVLYFLLWQPFAQRLNDIKQRVETQQALSQWMKTAAVQVHQLRQQSGDRSQANKSLLSIVDQTIRKSGLNKALKRVDPDGNSKVKVRLEQARFDTMTKWLEDLQQRFSVSVQTISIDRQDNAGVVNVRLTLIGAGT